jgi:hypothetical protein
MSHFNIRRIAGVLLGLCCAVVPASSQAEPSFALGVSGSWERRREFGADTHVAFVPELLGFHYRALGTGRWYLRPGVRLGYQGLFGVEMPRALKIVERDLTASGEVGFLRDGPVVPALVVGAGLTHRWVSLQTSAPLTVSEDAISRRQFLPRLYGQFGLGVPLFRGALVLEPHVRYERVFGDDRIDWRAGVDATAVLF